MGRSANVVTNYSTLPLREIFAGEEAGLRSDAVAEQLGPSSFNMPWINARADLMGAQVLMDDLAAVERSWSSLWDDAIASDGWERWLISGRLAAYRAEVDLTSGRLDDALTWSTRAIELAEQGSRRKYLANAKTTRGRVLTAQGETAGATAELRSAVALADGLGSPLLRWQARAALAVAERRGDAGTGDADLHGQEAVDIIHAIAKDLSPDRAKTYLAAATVVEALDLTR